MINTDTIIVDDVAASTGRHVRLPSRGRCNTLTSVCTRTVTDDVPSPRMSDQNPAGARAVEDKFLLPILWKDQVYPVNSYYGTISASNADVRDVTDYCELLAEELTLYPPDFFRRCNLRQIVLCRDLVFRGRKRGALPDFQSRVLYLNVLRGKSDPRYQRRVIHHELFHVIDEQDDRELYSDPEWSALNAETFQYGGGGATMQADGAAAEMSDTPGFLTRYATSGVEEDKAEVFSHMMTAYELVQKRATTDPVIRAKFSGMKSLVARFSRDMADAFWEKVSRRRP